MAAVRGNNLPQWLEAGVAEWAQRPVIWVSAINTGHRHPCQSAARGWTCRRSCAPSPPPLVAPTRCTSRASSTGPSAPRPLRSLRQRTKRLGRRSAALRDDGRRLRPADAVLAPPVSGQRGAPRGPGWVPASGLHRPPVAERSKAAAGPTSGRWAPPSTRSSTGSAPFQGIEEVPVVQALSRLLMAPAPALGELPAPVADLVAVAWPSTLPIARRPPGMWPTASTKRPQSGEAGQP